MGKLVDRAAGRNDAYELVRLANAFPDEGASIDEAVVEVAQRLAVKRKGEELAYLLTLPEADHPWHSLEEVNKQLIAFGPKAARLVKQATIHSHDAARLNGARVLEDLGDTEAAEQLRARVRSIRSEPALVPVQTWSAQTWRGQPWSGQWPQPYSYRPALRLTHSPVGIASFALSIAAMSASFFLGFAGFWWALASVASHRDLPTVSLVSTMVIAGVIALAGLVLGIIGLTQKDRNRAFPILGLVLSGKTILGLLSALPLAVASVSG